MLDKVFKFGKIRISVHTLLMLLFYIFFVSKELRAFSKTTTEGGIWNYIQLLLVLIGIILFIFNYRLFIRCLPFWFLLIFSVFAMLNSLVFVNFTLSSVFDYLLIPFALCIFIIAGVDSYHNGIENGVLLPFAFYSMTFIFIFNMIAVGSFSAFTGATADVYYILGLLPVVLMQTRLYKIIPLAACGVAVVISGKRTGIIILVLMVLVYFINNILNSRKIKTQLFYLIGLAAVIVGFVLLFNFINDEFNSNLAARMERIWEEQDSSGRYARWELIISSLKASPVHRWVFGYGNNGVYSIIGAHAHNDFLEVLFDFGLLPFACYVCFWVSLFVEIVRMFRSKYQYTVYLLMSLIFSIGLAMFSFLINDPSYVTSGMLCLGYFLFDFYDQTDSLPLKSKSPGLQKTVQVNA